MEPLGPPQSPRGMTRELSESTDKVTATQKSLEYLLFHPQSISSIFEVRCLVPLFLFSASLVALAEVLVRERNLRRKGGLRTQSVSLPKSQIEVCWISDVVAKTRLQATIDVGMTVGAEEAKRSS